MVETKKQQLPRTTKNALHQAEQKLTHLTHSVRLMDPINVLKRGYSITTINGKTISAENPAEEGNIIQTKTATFTLESEVASIQDNEQEN